MTKAASEINAVIQRKMSRSSVTTLIISNEELDDIRKIVRSFIESGLSIKVTSKTIKREQKKQKYISYIIKCIRH